MTYSVFELNPQKMRAEMETFVGRRPLNQTLRLRSALAQKESFRGWWYGAVEDGELAAIMAIENRKVQFHAANGDAAEAVAKTLLNNQRHTRSMEAHRHEITGDERSMARFWPTFRDIGRKIVADQAWFLMGAKTPLDNISKRMKLRFATPHNQALVEDFVAEMIVERYGFDPRRSNREAHKINVAGMIKAGRQLLGYEKEKPVMIAELAPVNEDLVELRNIWVPVALRSRKRLIGGAFAQATQLETCAGKELLIMATNTSMHEATKRAGLEQRAAFRHVAMVGR